MRHVASLLLSVCVLVSAEAAVAQEEVARHHIQEGLAAASAGDTLTAFAELERARKAAPKLADVHYYLGRLYTQRASSVETDFHDRVKAERALLKALRLRPSEPRYLLELARLRLKQNMKVDAARLFDRALKEAEKRGDPRVLAEVHYNLGYIKELWYRALEHRRLVPLLRGPPQDQIISNGLSGYVGADGPTRYGNTYIDDAPRISGSGEVAKQEMMEHYREALRYDPGHIGAAIRLMGQLLDEGRLTEYLAVGRRLKAAHPDEASPYLYLGLGLHRAGREEEAAEAFGEGLARLPDAERAEVENLAEVMRRDDAEMYLELGEEARREFNDRYWRLTDPLYLTRTNERRLEHLSRIAYADLRFSAPEAGLRGWQTDRGIIYIRYGPPESIASFAASPYAFGNPYSVGRRSIIWSYGKKGPVFIFRQTPGYLNARFAGDYKFVADNYRYIQPAIYKNIASIPELLDVPVQVARFRGDTAGQVAVEVYAALPLEDLARGVDIDRGELETGLFLLDSDGETIVRRVKTEILEYAESPYVDEYRNWELRLPPGGPLVLALEARDQVPRRSAASRMKLTVNAFPADSLALSDILVADRVRPLVEDPRKRSDYEIWPNAALEYYPGESIQIYYEVYGLGTDQEGFASYDVSLQLRVKRLTRGGGLSALLGLLADTWGFSIVGDDRLELRYSREVDMDGRDRVTEYLSLDPQELPPGEYEIRIRVWDKIAERMARVKRTFHVVEKKDDEG